LVHENRACARDYVPLNDAPGMIEFCWVGKQTATTHLRVSGITMLFVTHVPAVDQHETAEGRGEQLTAPGLLYVRLAGQ
jgi:hypothetical protein